MPPELVLSSPMIHLRSPVVFNPFPARFGMLHQFEASGSIDDGRSEVRRRRGSHRPLALPLLHALVEHHLESERGMASGSPTLLLAMNRIEDVLAWGYSNAMPDAGPDWTLSRA